jgi:hypothetical protein
MADVFISYSKADRPLALKLAAMLEAEGWKTWWDTSLIPGDDFRNEIMTELGRARAVIVIWTDASIKSDWVRSEAGRAQGDRKLIPVKLPNLSYKDLPPPFDVLHTEDIGQEDKIKAAVVAQLAKPAVEPTAVALLTKGFRYELLTWAGIVGGALTLFSNLGAFLKLADWARILVQHWKEWTHEFWVSAFGWLGIHLTGDWPPALSSMLFCSLLIVGQALQFRRTIKAQKIGDKHQGKSFQLISWRTLLWLISTLLFGFWWQSYAFVVITLMQRTLTPDFLKEFLGEIFYSDTVYDILHIGATVLISATPLAVIGIMFARFRLHASIAIVLMVSFWGIIAVSNVPIPLDYTPTTIDPIITSYVMIPALLLILLSVAPAKAISRRLIFLALGLLLLIALNELSNLGLDVTAPKLQGLSEKSVPQPLPLTLVA